MKRILSIFLGVSTSLLIPLVTFAGAVSVTQDYTIVLPSSGDSYTVRSGSTFNNLDVSGSSFTFTLDPKDQIIVISGNKRNLTNNRSDTICNSGDSRLILSVATTGAQVAVNVVPSGTCTESAATATDGGSGGGSGGGGSSGSSSPAPSSSPTPSPTSTPSPTTQPSPPITSVPSSVPAIPPLPFFETPFPPVIILRIISRGSQGDDVKKLQQFLASDTSIYPEGIVNGSFGPKTQLAVQRFQEKYGITKKGQPGYGVLGPKTKAKLEELSGKLSSLPSPLVSSLLTPPSLDSSISEMQAQLKGLQNMLKTLQMQAQLKDLQDMLKKLQ